jgi:uridine phosphorylase
MNSKQPLSQSVLPLNQDGSIYHLNLLPNEISDTIILVGDPDRVPLVSEHFDSIETRKQKREFVTHTGRLNGKRLSVLSTGIGAANIEIVLNELDALHNIDFNSREVKNQLTQLKLLRIGTCGALQEDTAVGEAILSQYAIGIDGAMSFYPHKANAAEQQLHADAIKYLNNSINSQCYVSACGTLLESFSTLGEMGITFTCPGFYAAQNRQLRIPIDNQGIINCMQKLQSPLGRTLNFEMETAMLYSLGKALGHNCGSISLAVYNRATEEEIDYQKRMPELIAKCLEILIKQ